ncbi:hypothetical protein ACVWXU_007732 [Streptomyces sp. TE33382]
MPVRTGSTHNPCSSIRAVTSGKPPQRTAAVRQGVRGIRSVERPQRLLPGVGPVAAHRTQVEQEVRVVRRVQAGEQFSNGMGGLVAPLARYDNAYADAAPTTPRGLQRRRLLERGAARAVTGRSAPISPRSATSEAKTSSWVSLANGVSIQAGWWRCTLLTARASRRMCAVSMSSVWPWCGGRFQSGTTAF